MHLVVNLANETTNNAKTFVIPNTGGVMLKINKALLISKRQNMFFNEEYYKYAIELKVGNEYWVIFRRFSEIREEHERALKKYPDLKKETFPPRSPFNKTDTFQIERQQKLEQYLKILIQTALADVIHDYSADTKKLGSPDQPAGKFNKEVFCDHLGFFAETTEDKLNVQKLGWKSGDEF